MGKGRLGVPGPTPLAFPRPAWDGHHGGDPLSGCSPLGCHQVQLSPLGCLASPPPAYGLGLHPTCWCWCWKGRGGSLEFGGCLPNTGAGSTALAGRGGSQRKLLPEARCSTRPLMLPPPALASQTTAACGESGWSLRGWAQVLWRKGEKGTGESCPPMPCRGGGWGEAAPLPLR